MNLEDRARLDMQQIVGNSNDFGVEINVVNPTDASTADVIGFHTKHYTGFDIDGVMVNSKTASVAIAEQQFIDAGFPIRNANGDVDLNDTLINVKDSTGIIKNYVIVRAYPDENLGLLVLILGDYKI